MKQPSHMSHDFSRVPKAEIPRSAFPIKYDRKQTFDADYLVPFYVDDVLPGDTFNLNCTIAARILSPLHTPIMDNLYINTFFFFVPDRLVWTNFERFMGAQDDPDDSTDYIFPVIVAPAVTGWAVQTLSDYFGLPIDKPGLSVKSAFHRSYNLIWNTWFRDENLQDSVVVDLDDGPDTNSDYVLLKRGKQHDYFTSCLPFPQKGPGVEIPISGDAPVIGLGVFESTATTGPRTYRESDGAARAYPFYTNAAVFEISMEASAATGSFPRVFADLSDVSAATINSLRQAFALQKLYERDARGGTRYIELIKAHYNVTSPDARLQRPEFLGGKTTPINITTVEQTSESATTPQGNLTSYGTVIAGREGFTKSFVEHGYVIGMVQVNADLTYQQGIPRMFSRSTRFDIYWPALATIGEQSVLNQEIYAVDPASGGGTGAAQNIAVFGYQERWAEYRYKASEICGKLRSQYATPLDSWHVAEEFGALPVLGDTFIKTAVPMDRVIAVTDEPDFIMDAYVRGTRVRAMPAYSVPGNVDRF